MLQESVQEKQVTIKNSLHQSQQQPKQIPHLQKSKLSFIQQAWKTQCKALQKLLKQQHSLLWTQNQQKQSFQKKLSQSIIAYHRTKIHSYSSIKPTITINHKTNQKQSKKVSNKIKQQQKTVQSSKSIKTKQKQSAASKNDKKLSNQKILLQDEGFGDSCFYIKEILLTLSKDPQLIITIIKRHHSLSSGGQEYSSIVKAIVHSMYENIVDDDIYNKDFFIILNECFKLMVEGAKHYYDIKFLSNSSYDHEHKLRTNHKTQENSISYMIAKEFLQKAEIKAYSKQVIRNMVLEIGKIDHQVSFSNGQDDKNDSKKERENTSSSNNAKVKKIQSKSQYSPVKDQRINPRSKVDNLNSKITQYAQALQVKDQKISKSQKSSSEQKNPVKRQKNRKCASKQLLKYLGITQEIQFPTFVSTTANNQIKKQQQINKQWAAMLSHKQSITQINPDIILIKNIVLIFFSDLFKMLYTLPLSLRIACKIFYNNLQSKFINKKYCFYVLAEYVLGFCIIKNITIDEASKLSSNIYQKEKSTVPDKKDQKSKGSASSYIRTNLNTFASIIMSVIRNDFKNVPKSFQYQFNLIVSNLRISLFNYLTQIVNIDLSKMTKLISNKKDKIKQQLQSPSVSTTFLATAIQKIKSYSVCVNISDVKKLFQMIKFCKTQLKNINKNDKLIKRIQRTQMVNDGKDIFKQRQDKSTRTLYKPQNAYIMFYELQLPKQLSINYIKYHDGYFKNDKFKKMLKLMLLSIKNIQNFIEFYEENTLYDFLKRLSEKSKQYFQIDSMMHMENIDHVPIQIKIKYIVSLIKNSFNLKSQQSNDSHHKTLYQIISLMYKQAVQRTQYYKSIWDKSKQCYLKALSSVMYLNQIITNNQIVIQKNIKSKLLDEFINKTKISICLTSPLTRDKQIASRTNYMKQLSQEEKSKIWLENQSRCIHSTLNLQFIKSLTGQPDKGKRQQAHCNNIMKFADILCSLPQLRLNNSSLSNVQDIGIKQAFFDFIKYCSDLIAKEQQSAKKSLSQDKDWLQQTLQQKLSKKIYDKLYPKDPTYQDVAFYFRLKTLDFINYTHLKIKPCLRFDKMWQLAGRQLRMMDKVKTASQKLNCINECSKIITDSYHLINQNDQPATAQDIYPIIIYVLIKAAPKRMISNMNFIQSFASQNRLMQKQGYAYTQLKSAIQFLDSLTQQKLQYQNMTNAEKAIQFRKTIYEKQVEYGIYFLLLRKNIPHEVQKKNLMFLKDFFSNLSMGNSLKI